MKLRDMTTLSALPNEAEIVSNFPAFTSLLAAALPSAEETQTSISCDGRAKVQDISFTIQ